MVNRHSFLLFHYAFQTICDTVGVAYLLGTVVLDTPVMHMLQVHSERKRLSTVLALSCAPQRHSARFWRQHAQRHIPEQRGQMLLC